MFGFLLGMSSQPKIWCHSYFLRTWLVLYSSLTMNELLTKKLLSFQFLFPKFVEETRCSSPSSFLGNLVIEAFMFHFAHSDVTIVFFSNSFQCCFFSIFAITAKRYINCRLWSPLHIQSTSEFTQLNKRQSFVA